MILSSKHKFFTYIYLIRQYISCSESNHFMFIVDENKWKKTVRSDQTTGLHRPDGKLPNAFINTGDSG